MSRSKPGRAELFLRVKQVTRIRARQVELIRQLDRYQVDTAEGARTMGDWTSAQLDCPVRLRAGSPSWPTPKTRRSTGRWPKGRWGLDRSAALVKLRQAGISPDLFAEAAEKYSLGRLYGLLDRLRHLTPADESDLFESRFLVIQPNLDESVFKLWGQLPGVDGRIVEKALAQREGDLPTLPDQSRAGRGSGGPTL